MFPWTVAAPIVVAALATTWATVFGYLSVTRYLAGGAHAEDLGFTDQVVWNFLRGQFFRMSIYSGATWNTEIDVSRILRPDSLLAFHVEPLLLLFVPLYALGAGATALLVIQSVAVAAGAVPAYRLGRHFTRSELCGVAAAGAYLLSPLGQWAVLSDFHTSTLAAPLILFSLERLLVAGRPLQSVVVAVLALSTREDVGPLVAAMGLMLLLGQKNRHVGAAYATLGAAWTILSLAIIRSYSGGISPFDVRYGSTLLGGLGPGILALGRPAVLGYVQTLLLSGGWLGLLAPLALLPALPLLALNGFSSSPWMAAGQAHYSGLILPVVTVAAAAGLGRLGRWPRLQGWAAVSLAVTSLAGYVLAGAGPGGANYAPAEVTPRAELGQRIAASLPREAAVSASTSLVPWLSERARAYVFPSVSDADFVLLDLRATPAPTSAGDVYLRTQALLDSGDWLTVRNEDGLLLLERAASPYALEANDDSAFARGVTAVTSGVTAATSRIAAVTAGVTSPSQSVTAASQSVTSASQNATSVVTSVTPAVASVTSASQTVTSTSRNATSVVTSVTPAVASVTSASQTVTSASQTVTAPALSVTSASPAVAAERIPARSAQSVTATAPAPTLLAAALVPSPDGAIDVDGPRWILRTTWQIDAPLPPGTHLDLTVNLRHGEQLHLWDIADLWWNPPERWPVQQPVTIDVPNIPQRSFTAWSATWSTR